MNFIFKFLGRDIWDVIKHDQLDGKLHATVLSKRKIKYCLCILEYNEYDPVWYSFI